MDIILGRTKYSKLRRGGVQYSNLRYDSDDLASLRGKIGSCQVMYKVDPDDLGVIHVFIEHERRYLKVPAVDFEYADGLSEWQHKVHKKYARTYIRKKYRHDDVVAARNAIRELVKREIDCWDSHKKIGKNSTSVKAARYAKVADNSSGSISSVVNDSENNKPIDESDASSTDNDDWYVPIDRTSWSSSGGEE